MAAHFSSKHSSHKPLPHEARLPGQVVHDAASHATSAPRSGEGGKLTKHVPRQSACASRAAALTALSTAGHDARHWLIAAQARGIAVLIGDPGRTYLPRDRLDKLAEYAVPVTRDLEDAEIKRSAVWAIRNC